MSNGYVLPELADEASPSEYAGNLRNLVFPSARAVAAIIPVHPATASEYEKEPGITPPLGYLACLARLLVEKHTLDYNLSDREVEQLRVSLLVQLRDLVLSRQRRRYYQGVSTFKNWGELNQSADAFIAKQRELRRVHDERDVNRRPSSKEPQLIPGVGAPPLGSPLPPTGATGPSIVPQLPPQGVVGREDYLAQISNMLVLNDPSAVEVPPLALMGFGGVGKSTLAIAIGRDPEVVRLFPQGILWTELGPKPGIRSILNTWGKVLGIDLLPEQDEQSCAVHLREALYHRRVLLIVDDVWEINHSTHFLIGGPHCRTLFTTRESPIAYDLATRDRTLRVNVLKLPAAMDMLGRFASEVIAMDPQAAEKLCQKLECLPLALKLAGRLLAIEADVPSRMRRVLDELIERRDLRLGLIQAEGDLRVDILSGTARERTVEAHPDEKDQTVSLKAILGMSVDRLSRKEQDRFAMLAEFGGEPLTWDIKGAAAVWECSLQEAEATTLHFVQRGLVEPRADQRYWMHALLCDYAEELMVERDL